MAKKNYTEEEVVTDLNRKHDIHINPVTKQIQELKYPTGMKGTPAKGDVGIKSKGKIDFLVHYKNYVHFHVNKFEK